MVGPGVHPIHPLRHGQVDLCGLDSQPDKNSLKRIRLNNRSHHLIRKALKHIFSGKNTYLLKKTRLNILKTEHSHTAS